MVCRGLAYFERIVHRLRRSLQSRAGGTVVLVAVCAPVLLTLVGFTIDYSYASYVNSILTRAGDASVLAAVSQSAATAVGGYANTSGLQTYGTQVFNASIRNAPTTNVNYTLNVSQSPQSGLVTASGSFNYAVPTFFGSLIGIKTINVANSIQATALPTTYINYYLLVDISNSMGIASTPNDMTNLYNAVKAYRRQFAQDGEYGCVFACHAPLNGWSVSTEQIARANNIVLRIDAAKTALQNIINNAAAAATDTRNISFGIYLLDTNPSTGTRYVTLASQTTDYTSLINNVNTIDLANTVGSQTPGDTDAQNYLSDFNRNVLPPNGSGSSATAPQNYVFLITDGVADVFNPSTCPTTSCFYPVNPAWCAPLKGKSTLGVIYTTYLDIWRNNDPTTNAYESLYNATVVPFKNQIMPNLTACATSSDYFFQANDGPALISQVQALFAKTQPISARLTQ